MLLARPHDRGCTARERVLFVQLVGGVEKEQEAKEQARVEQKDGKHGEF